MSKKLIFSLSFVVMSFCSYAQSDAYKNTMQGLIIKMDAAQTAESFVPVQNGFERIASAEAKEWLPKYYSAYTAIMQAMLLSDKSQVDGILDKADETLNQAMLINSNDELMVLQALSNSTRIGVDPMSRGMKYGMESAKLLEQAKKINPENPRIYFLQAQSAFYTPEAFGGGKAKAKELFSTSIQKYDLFKLSNNLMPNWGAAQAKEMLEKCK
jgi:hypothetical protein